MDLNKLILNVLNDQASSDEYDQLKNWRDEAQFNMDNMKDFSDIWDKTDDLKEYKDFDSDRAWVRFERSIKKENNWILVSLVACLAFLIGFFAFSYTNDKEVIVPSQYQSQNEVVNYALQDNSNIWLNKNSKVDLLSDFSDVRTVALKGEAYFDIAKVKNKTFIVDLGSNGRVEVLGTEFNIINTDSNFELYVTEGSVAYITEGKNIRLNVGDALKKMKDGSIVKYRMNKSNYLSWKTKLLEFNDTPIYEVLNVLSDNFDVKISMDKILTDSDCKLRSKFSGQDFNSIIIELEKIFNLKYRDEKGSMHFYYVKC